MEETIREIIKDAAESNLGKSGKYIADIGLFIIDTAQNRRDLKRRKMKVFSNKIYDKNSKYMEIMLKNFVSRKFQYYGVKNKKHVSIYKIKSNIENTKYWHQNIIITGQAGMGKSTALKWLYYKSNIKNSKFIFLYSKMFFECKNLDDFLTEIAKKIPNDKKCIIFFDGLDELPFIKGTAYEFQQIINFFDKSSNRDSEKPNCKFVISTRQEHFNFKKMFIEKNLERNPENYSVYEIQMLNPKEAFKICKSIKKLSQYEQRCDGNEFGQHFTNKWPSKEMKNNSLTEKEYIKLLKKYLQSNLINDSLLNSPLLCRYGYQIICDWNSQGQSFDEKNGKTQSDKIKKVLECCIKWEFHDHFDLQTQGRKGKEKFECYEYDVFDFLVQVAGRMGSNDYIAIDEWDKLKTEKNILLNDALCVLQEGGSGELEFIHNTFKNYFLACFYASKKNEENCEKNEILSSLLKSSSEFSEMYVEQLIVGSNKLAKRVCNELMKIHNINIEELAEYARGNMKLIYTETISFTIEEYLNIFQDGSFLYEGITFDRDTLQINGILRVEKFDNLMNCRKEVISINPNYITGIETCIDDIECIGIHFFIYGNNVFHRIDAYGKNTAKNGDLYKQKSENEHKRMFSLMDNMIYIIGNDKRYWCLFNGNSSVFVYQINQNNENIMSILFSKSKLMNPMKCAMTYGLYKAMTESETVVVDNGYFYEISNIPYTFDANHTFLRYTDNFLCQYYKIYRDIIYLLRKKTDNEDNLEWDRLKQNFHAKYSKVFSCLEDSLSEKLKLYFNDEQLLISYIFEESEKMRNLAQHTLELCEKYQNQSGVEFRKYLLRDNIAFNGHDLDKVYKFANTHIWM